MQVIIMPSVNIIGSILFELPITQSSYLKSIIDQEMWLLNLLSPLVVKILDYHQGLLFQIS